MTRTLLHISLTTLLRARGFGGALLGSLPNARCDPCGGANTTAVGFASVIACRVTGRSKELTRGADAGVCVPRSECSARATCRARRGKGASALTPASSTNRCAHSNLAAARREANGTGTGTGREERRAAASQRSEAAEPASRAAKEELKRELFLLSACRYPNSRPSLPCVLAEGRERERSAGLSYD